MKRSTVSGVAEESDCTVEFLEVPPIFPVLIDLVKVEERGISWIQPTKEVGVRHLTNIQVSENGWPFRAAIKPFGCSFAEPSLNKYLLKTNV